MIHHDIPRQANDESQENSCRNLHPPNQRPLACTQNIKQHDEGWNAVANRPFREEREAAKGIGAVILFTEKRHHSDGKRTNEGHIRNGRFGDVHKADGT